MIPRRDLEMKSSMTGLKRTYFAIVGPARSDPTEDDLRGKILRSSAERFANGVDAEQLRQPHVGDLDHCGCEKTN